MFNREWLATVYYDSEVLGNIDVDYGVNSLDELHRLIVNGPGGYSAVRFIEVHRLEKKPVLTIEALQRRVSQELP